MKIVFIAVSLLFGLSIYAQDLPVNEEGRIEFTAEVEATGLSKEELYFMILNWFEENYNKKQRNPEVIHTTNLEEGIVEASPLLWMYVHSIGQNTGGGSVIYNIKVNTFDHKYIYSLYDFDHESNRSRFGSGGPLENENPECGEEEMSKAVWIEIKENTRQQCEKIINDLRKYMREEG